MPKVLLTSLDPRLQKQASAAEQTLRSNPQYAVEIAQGILHRHPECAEVRRLLRKAQKLVYGNSAKGLGHFIGNVTSFAGLMGNSKLIDTDPLKAVEFAEKSLAKKPADVQANKMLAAAAEKLGWHDTAAFAYEELAHADPKNPGHYAAAAAAYVKDEDFDSALRVSDDALRLFPGNGDLQEVARRASVAKTVQKGKWEGDGDFKDKLKSKDEALALDKSGRVVQDAEEAIRIVTELEQKIAADPENVDYYREAVRQYQLLGDLDRAILALQRARQTNIGRADAALEKQENELSMALYAKRVAELAQQLEADPENAELRAQYENERNAEAAYKLQITQALVERYPNDYGYRYNYGILLLETGHNDDAIQQLQFALRSPKNRHNAMLNLARAFANGNKFDLAADQLQTAKGEILTMSEIKKEIIYELGNALEKLGRVKEAIDEYKVLYMSDSSYKNVSQKINAFYEKQR
ncbi:MAG: tetratricopeptide repeat protein [Puniceicoccales bacterium]|jgi:tetratricopeptide (TPR) repeat protein|nr:tetratricopeptide repeat protein [Puniceicoccales bacterium]